MTLRHVLDRLSGSGGVPPAAAGSVARRSHLMRWLCVAIFLLLAGATLAVFEPSLWRALLVAMLLACPLVAIRGFFLGLRPLPVPVGDVPRTDGRVLNWVAPYYDSICPFFGIGRAFRERTLAVAALRPGDTVVDLGCGTGTLAIAAAQAVGAAGHVLGVDAAPDMIRVSRIKAATARSRARFELAAAEALPVDDASIDVAVASLLLHHLPPRSKRQALGEAFRVLRPGGRLVVIDIDRPGNLLARISGMAMLPFARFTDHLHGHVPQLLTEAGFMPPEPQGRALGAFSFWLTCKPLPAQAIRTGAHLDRT